MKSLFRKRLRGGGNRSEVRDIVRGTGFTAKSAHKNSSSLRHSERLAKESSLLQYKAAAKNENNSTETDHASMPLRLFASKSTSKSVSCRHSNTDLHLASLPSIHPRQSYFQPACEFVIDCSEDFCPFID